ncbi:MAG: type II toxin-antitoxin system VapC family toxin [Spirochaetia bacterium]|nr:type II toxin-antitoxin system VapC family toxin [Spirochaetia bacterium]
MKFWDSSAVVPMIVEEPRTSAVLAVLDSDPAVWWGTRVECLSALARLSREGIFDRDAVRNASEALVRFTAASIEVQPTEQVRNRAERLLRVHSLRAGDSLQLAAALVLFGEQTHGQVFVSLDDRLRSAAEKEGFTVLPLS